jgi:DNA mismatch repair protein MutL
MQDIIQLLPDHISNQIAAGEVIQRPASALKELVENAIDAKATKIDVIVKQAGKTLLQVNDNGIGMSRTDARLCFEKHATSKIRQVEDLFKITSKGFRGEALASIAAVAQVEMKTRREIDDVGTSIAIESSKVVSQEPCNTPVGTQFLMKNLFYNIPARRNFLKSDAEELRQMLNEFERLALSNEEISFTFYHNDKEVYRLPASNLKKRILQVLGNQYDDRLVPVEEQSDIIKISGFVTKPNVASVKMKGKQYLFVNKRFVKSPFIQHAIFGAYKNLINQGDYPPYLLFVDIDPKMIDVNVHPTKQEIKFEDEQLVYGFVNAGIRRSLMQFNIAPSLDFSVDYQLTNMPGFVHTNFQTPGKETVRTENFSSVRIDRPMLSVTKGNDRNWEEIFKNSLVDVSTQHEAEVPLFPVNEKIEIIGKAQQLMNKYILVPSNLGILILDQRRTHERILYDQLQRISLKESIPCQKLLFPMCVEFDVQDAFIVEDILNDINHLGFDISPMGNNNYAIQGIPSDLTIGNEKELLFELIQNFKQTYKANTSKKETLLIAICKLSSVKRNQILKEDEIDYLVEHLFASEQYQYTPSGKNIYYVLEYQELDRKFK